MQRTSQEVLPNHDRCYRAARVSKRFPGHAGKFLGLHFAAFFGDLLSITLVSWKSLVAAG
jgi:hypothetical protein